MPLSLDEFIDAVHAECDASHPDWVAKADPLLGSEVPTTRNRFVANETERNLIQQLGNAYGCHTCDQMIQNTPPRFIVDHIPPREMMGSINYSCQYRFFPHCDSCASEQSALVRRYASAHTPQDRKIRDAVRRGCALPTESHLIATKVRLQALGIHDIKQRKLLCGGRFNRSIAGRYGDPSGAERQAVNLRGRAYGCHSCGTRVPMRTYHADHCPPREFSMTAWFPTLMRNLGAPLPNHWAFRPQCPDCSHKQGSRCRTLVREAQRFTAQAGVIRYTA